MPRSRSLTRLTMRVGLLHLGQSVDFVVSITFWRSPVFAIFAMGWLVLLLGLSLHTRTKSRSPSVGPGQWGDQWGGGFNGAVLLLSSVSRVLSRKERSGSGTRSDQFTTDRPCRSRPPKAQPGQSHPARLVRLGGGGWGLGRIGCRYRLRVVCGGVRVIHGRRCPRLF